MCQVLAETGLACHPALIKGRACVDDKMREEIKEEEEFFHL